MSPGDSLNGYRKARKSSRYFPGELSTILTGRHLTVELFPFDPGELRMVDPTATWKQYLERGGFPETLRMPDGDRLRRQYFHDIIERDIRERKLRPTSQFDSNRSGG